MADGSSSFFDDKWRHRHITAIKKDNYWQRLQRFTDNETLFGLVPLDSIPELPAETCKEIKASEGEKAVSGKYWFDSIEPGNVLLAYCNMSTEGEFN